MTKNHPKLLIMLLSLSMSMATYAQPEACKQALSPQLVWNDVKVFRQELTQRKQQQRSVADLPLIASSLSKMTVALKDWSKNQQYPRYFRQFSSTLLTELGQPQRLNYERFLDLSHRFVIARNYTMTFNEKKPGTQARFNELLDAHLSYMQSEILDAATWAPDAIILPYYGDLEITNFNRLWFLGLIPLGITDDVQVDNVTRYFATGFYVHDWLHFRFLLDRLIATCERDTACIQRALAQTAWFYEHLQVAMDQEPNMTPRIRNLIEVIVSHYSHEQFKFATEGSRIVSMYLYAVSERFYLSYDPMTVSDDEFAKAAEFLLREKHLEGSTVFGLKDPKKLTQKDVALALKVIARISKKEL